MDIVPRAWIAIVQPLLGLTHMGMAMVLDDVGVPRKWVSIGSCPRASWHLQNAAANVFGKSCIAIGRPPSASLQLTRGVQHKLENIVLTHEGRQQHLGRYPLN